MKFDPEILGTRFITKVKRRGRLQTWSRWLVIGGVALAACVQWTATPNGISKETYLVERVIDKRLPPSDSAPLSFSVVVFTTATGGNNFVIPAGVTSITLQGIGGGGHGYENGTWGGGGAGAGYAASTITVSPGGRLYYNVGVHGGTSATGATWANYNTNAAPSSSSTGIFAPYGPTPTSSLGVAAITSGGVGTTVYYGGNGGSIGAGGGAAGPSGAGKAGGSCSPLYGLGGAGGGGANGGSSTAGPSVPDYGSTGLAGGNGTGGTGAGAGGGASSPGGNGSAGGGGGGGGGGAPTTGGAGGSDTAFDASHGAGGGGGAGGYTGAGGAGGLYGGGGGRGASSGSTSGPGAQGILVLTYIVILIPSNFTPAFSFLGIA